MIAHFRGKLCHGWEVYFWREMKILGKNEGAKGLDKLFHRKRAIEGGVILHSKMEGEANQARCWPDWQFNRLQKCHFVRDLRPENSHTSNRSLRGPPARGKSLSLFAFYSFSHIHLLVYLGILDYTLDVNE
jgi:hypothetical protein